jgi:hypothetical protein
MTTQDPGAGTAAGNNLATNLQALSGNWVVIYMANQPVGYLQNFSAQDDYGLQPLSGIGDAHVQEYVPGIAMHTLTADRAVIRKKSLFDILGGQGDGWKDFANMDGVLLGKVFDIVVYKKKDPTSGNSQGAIVRSYQNCSLGASSMTIGKNAIIYMNVTIHALDVNGALNAAQDWQSGQQVTDMDSVTGKP